MSDRPSRYHLYISRTVLGSFHQALFYTMDSFTGDANVPAISKTAATVAILEGEYVTTMKDVEKNANSCYINLTLHNSDVLIGRRTTHLRLYDIVPR